MDDLTRKPKLIRNCRLSESGTGDSQGAMLLMPEGVIRLSGTARDIVALCDGEREIRQIVAELRARYPTADAATIERDALEFLERLREKRVLDF